MTNFARDGELDDSDIAQLDVEARQFATRRLHFGDIILEKSGGGPKQPVGRVCLFDKSDGDFSFSNFTSALRVRNPQELDFRYLHRFLHWTYLSGVTEEMQSHSTGIRNLNGSAYKAIRIPLAPLAEQQRVVGILDDVFEGVASAKANAEKNLQNARALFDSHLEAVVAQAWREGELVTLSDLATDVTDGDHMPPPKSSAGVPFITIGNIAKDSREIDFTNTFTVPAAYYAGLKENKKPRRGDVLYTVTGSFGIPLVVDGAREFCFQRHIGLIRPRSDTDSSWLCYLLLSPQVFKQANDRATGTAQRTVSLKVLRELVVPKLAPSQQHAAADELDALLPQTRELEFIYQRKLEALEELKMSLLHEAFTGQLGMQAA